MKIMKKVSVAAIVGFALLGTTVFASTGKVYNTSKGLVLRGSASKSGAPLATVPNDKEFEILEDLGEWYKVKVDGEEGYLFAEYVKVVEDTKPVEPPVEQKPGNDEPVENTNSNSTKTETKLYRIPLITGSSIGTIPANTEIKVEKTLNNWVYVSYGNIKGWIRAYNYNTGANPVEEQKPEDTETKPEENPETKPEEETKPETTETSTVPAEDTNVSFTKGYINGSSVNVRKEPNTKSGIVTTLLSNTTVTITAQTEEWYKITYGNYTGYVYKPLISDKPVVTSRGNEPRQPAQTQEQEATVENTEQSANNNTEQPANNEQPVVENKEEPKVEENPQIVTPAITMAAGNKIASYAKQYIGYRYVLGGTSPSSGFDCSGFVYYVFNSSGYSISRTLSAQANTGVAVKKSELQPGDVVFFNNTSSGSLGHVGIYIGDGRMVHAANSRRGVVTDTINSGYYNTYYYTARRIAQ